ncbi:MAG: hypothetical protein C5S46_00485, partial [Candidatus Methanomarinus sp.]
INAPHLISTSPLITISPALMPSPIRFTLATLPLISIFTSAASALPSTVISNSSDRSLGVLPSYAIIAPISCALLPAKLSGVKITVFGNARDYVGEHLCGGEITIKGNAGILPGISNKGGKIIIEGDTAMPGSEMTKGTIIVKGTVTEMMPVYQKEGIETIDGVEYTKYVGDVVVDGAGELFVK